MAVVFPQGIEVFANSPSCVASTYQSGSSTADAPAAGTTESWAMGTGSTSFPSAQTATVPNNYFYVRDPADATNEIVLVTDNTTTPGTWAVQRGMNGATATHAAGATWVQVVSPYTLASFKQTPGASTTAVTVSTANETVLHNYQPLVAELQAGNSWDVIAFGPVGPQHIAAPVLTFSLYWGGSGAVGSTFTSTGSALLARIKTAQNIPALGSTIAAGANFDINGDVVWLSSTTAHANMNLWLSGATITSTAVNATTVNTASATGQSQSGPVTISGNGPIILTALWSTVAGSQTLTAVAPIIRRAA